MAPNIAGGAIYMDIANNALLQIIAVWVLRALMALIGAM